MHRLQSYSEIFIMAKLSKKEEEQRQQHAKNGYWQNELDSLGIFQDYKLAYSDKGDAHTEQAESTVTVG